MGQVGSRQEQFWEACSFGRVWLVKQMIEEGIDVNWVSHVHDSCPIHVASQGKPEVVKLLIESGCAIDSLDFTLKTSRDFIKFYVYCTFSWFINGINLVSIFYLLINKS